MRYPLLRPAWLFFRGCFLFWVVFAFAFGVCIFLSPKPPLLDHVSFSTAYYDRKGQLLRLSLSKDEAYRVFVPLNEISPDLVAATLRQEDRFFYAHPGVNPFALLRAVYETIAGSRTMGGSTITMQVVRLRDSLDSRSIGGKLLQLGKALQLERHYSKHDILEAYLNLAPYGGNIHGTGAASLIYFSRAPDQLAPPQSLALAVIPQNPVKRSPLSADKRALETARLRLLHRMPAPFDVQDPNFNLPLAARAREDLPFLVPHLIDGLRDESNMHPRRVDTTIDLRIQRLIERRITSWINRQKEIGLDNAAVLLVDAPTMEVRALLGSGDYFNKTISGQVDGTHARRSPGSTLKPFIYALALEEGLIHPGTLISDDPAWFAEYRPANFDRSFTGDIPASEALVTSRNIPAIRLAARLRNPGLYDFLQKAGADFPKDESHYGLSIAVGGAETDMRTLVKLYAMLANGGVLKDLRYTKQDRDTGGTSLLSPEAAYLTLDMLGRPGPDPLPFAADALPVRVYWKTGTSNGYKDAWTIGIVGPYVLAVWTGHFDGRPDPALIGVQAAAPLFFDLADSLTRSDPHALRDLVGPAMARLNLARVAICQETGAVKACGHDREGWYIPGKSPIVRDPALQKAGSQKPEILSPRSGVSYVASRSSDAPLRIPLEARDYAGRKGVKFWFDNNVLIATDDPSDKNGKNEAGLFWTPTPGPHTIRYVDADGHSAMLKLTVMTSE